jgi:hypothetical protein
MMYSVARWISVLLAIVILMERSDVRPFSGQQSEHKKEWSGKTFRTETKVQRTPSVSIQGPGFLSERVVSGEDDWEPAIAADPGSNYVYHMTTRFSGPQPCPTCPLPAIVFRSSADSGLTWSVDRFVPSSSFRQADPEMEVANDGTIYAAFLDGRNLKFIKSSNRGKKWSRPILFAGQGRFPSYADKPIIIISADGKDVYIGFNAGDSYIVASHDFGKTFSDPVRSSRTSRTWFHTGGAVDQNGTAYFSTTDFGSGYRGDSNISLLKSSDGGKTWSTARVDTSKEQPGCPAVSGCYFGFLGPSAAMAVDAIGRIMIAYHANDETGSAQKMFIRTSFDGVQWSSRKRVSMASAVIHNAFPALSVGISDGDFRLAWQGDRDGTMQAWNTWFRQTKNGGRTWSKPRRLSDLGSGAPYKQPRGFQFPYGDYFEIAVDSKGTNHIIWGEGDSYRGPAGSWYTSGSVN